MQKDAPTVFRASALKYRPQTLSEVVGQEVLVKTLENSFKNKRLAHAYIFTGVRGVGKTSTARLLARGLNCQGPDGKGSETPNPCGTCPPCQDILKERSLDVIEIDAASQTGVDDVRQLIENVSYKPVSGRYKVYIVDEVHMLSKSAFNALLKTLEEPPEHVKFFFATTEIEKVPMTILSRCQRFDLRRIPDAALKAHLTSLLEKEGLAAEEKALSLLVAAAEGSARDALSLMDQAINQSEGTTITDAAVEGMLGYARHQDVIQLLALLLKGQTEESLTLFRSLYEKGISCLSLCNRLLHSLHTLSLALSTEKTQDLSTLEQELLSTLNVPTLTRLWQVILKGIEEIKASPQESIALEMLLIRLCYLHPLPNLVDLTVSTLGIDEKKKSSAVKEPSFSNVMPSKPPAQPVAAAPIQTQSLESSSPKTPTEEEPQPPITLSDEQLANLAYEHREPVLASHLTHSLAILSCENGTLTYAPLKPLPEDFDRDLQKKLTAWLKSPWEVKKSSDQTGLSLNQKKEEALKKRLQDYEKSDTFKQLKTVFPNAKPIKIEERTAS